MPARGAPKGNQYGKKEIPGRPIGLYITHDEWMILSALLEPQGKGHRDEEILKYARRIFKQALKSGTEVPEETKHERNKIPGRSTTLYITSEEWITISALLEQQGKDPSDKDITHYARLLFKQAVKEASRYS